MFDMIGKWWAWYNESGLASATLSVSLVEALALFLTLTVCFLFRFPRVGLLVAYGFVYKWGWSARGYFLPVSPIVENVFTVVYLACGIIVLTLSIISMVWRQQSEG